jgi:peptidoglycan/LPS O-acetylase OafA/YrhL
MMTHTRIDTIMFGFLAALLADSASLWAAVRRAVDLGAQWVAIFWISVVSPLLAARFQGVYLFPLGYALDAACITLVMLWLIDQPGSFVGRLLNRRAVVHLGGVSYSFYLWQQLFTPLGPLWAIGPTVLMAEASFRFIERPFLRLRERYFRDDRSRSRPLVVKTGLPTGLPYREEYRDGIISA